MRNAAVPGSSPTLTTSGFVLGRPEFKSSATLVNIQLAASCQLRVFNPVMLYYNFFFKSLSVVPPYKLQIECALSF